TPRTTVSVGMSGKASRRPPNPPLRATATARSTASLIASSDTENSGSTASITGSGTGSITGTDSITGSGSGSYTGSGSVGETGAGGATGTSGADVGGRETSRLRTVSVRTTRRTTAPMK